jgi:ferritin-like protein
MTSGAVPTSGPTGGAGPARGSIPASGPAADQRSHEHSDADVDHIPEAYGSEDFIDDRASLDDPAYRAGVVELLGLLGAGEYLAFERLISEASLAPTLAQRLRIADIAQGELEHHRLLRDRLVELGEDPDEVMSRFLPPLERYHAMTAPSDWLEGLVKAYVGDSIATDFYREIGAVLDEDTASLVMEVCSELGQTGVVVDEVRSAIRADPRLAGRLALWGRRLLGEMLSQAQTVAAEHDALADLIMSEQVVAHVDLVELLTRLTAAHAERMQALGLAP